MWEFDRIIFDGIATGRQYYYYLFAMYFSTWVLKYKHNGNVWKTCFFTVVYLFSSDVSVGIRYFPFPSTSEFSLANNKTVDRKCPYNEICQAFVFTARCTSQGHLCTSFIHSYKIIFFSFICQWYTYDNHVHLRRLLQEYYVILYIYN